MKKIIITLFIFTTTYLFSFEDYLGSTPNQIVENLGAPDHVFVERGDDDNQDDVVFFYNNRVYIYFNQNRAWQIRLDKDFIKEVIDISINEDKKSIKEKLGEPMQTIENSFVYKRDDRGYPVFLRLYFKDDKLEELYFYRGDY